MNSSSPSKTQPRLVKTLVPLRKRIVPVYSGPKAAAALKELTGNMGLYEGVKFGQALEALYEQGRKDGAREVKEAFEQTMKAIPYRNPGKPRRK